MSDLDNIRCDKCGSKIKNFIEYFNPNTEVESLIFCFKCDRSFYKKFIKGDVK